MTAAVTVLGLVQGGYLLEDIRTVVPHRMAIQIPGHLAERSQDLLVAIQQQRVMKLGAAPATVGREPPLNPALRGRGIAPHHLSPVAKVDPVGLTWTQERTALLTELEASQQQCQRLQGLNEQLQGVVAGMSTQLAEIQRTLEMLVRTGLPAAPLTSRVSPVDMTVPQFIPSTATDAAEVRINLTEKATTSNVEEARAALRTLRGRSA